MKNEIKIIEIVKKMKPVIKEKKIISVTTSYYKHG